MSCEGKIYPTDSATGPVVDDETRNPSQIRLRTLPLEILRQIFEATGAPSEVILVAIDEKGEEHELLTGERLALSRVCRKFRGAIQDIGTLASELSSLPRVHVHKGSFRFFFDLDAEGVQTRIDSSAARHKEKLPVTEKYIPSSFYPHGWGSNRYEDFIKSDKNKIEVLVLPTMQSSAAGYMIAEDRPGNPAANYAKNTCITLIQLRTWAETKGRDGSSSRLVSAPDRGP